MSRRATVTLLGVSVALVGPAEAVEKLERLFGAMLGVPTAHAAVLVELEADEPVLDLPSRVVADQVVQRGAVYNLGPRTWIRHHGWGVSRFDFSTERGRITAPLVDDLVELAYLMVLSRLGAALEAKGYVRVHAAAFEHAGRGALFLAPSGGGKSTLVNRLLRDARVRILGDDVGLVDRGGELHAWPASLGLRDPSDGGGLGPVHAFPRRFHGLKHVLDSRSLGEHFSSGPVPLERVYLGRWASHPPARIRPARLGERIDAIAKELVVGVGLPQVVELVVPRGLRDAPSQWRSLERRLRAAARILRSARVLTVEADTPAASAERVLDDLLGS